MNAYWRELFKAIHEGYWVSIEYHNKQEKTTNYWIRIKDLDPLNRTLFVEGMHLGMYTLKDLKLFIDSITDAKVIEGSYAPVNETLVKDISDNPEKYKSIFSNVANMKILNYLADCNRMDQNPYETKFALVDHVDDEVLENQTLNLSEEQFKQIVRGFENKKKKSDTYHNLQFSQFGINILSLHTNRGKYILAYQPLRLDVSHRQLSAFGDIVICSEFTINGTRQSIRQYLDADDIHLLDDFKQNAEKIRNAIAENNPNVRIDDMPYLIQVARDSLISLDAEYSGILKMYAADTVTIPIQAFFGELTVHSRRKKSYPFALVNKQINMDQLLAMNHAMRYPVSYVQGPPGTGKTMTIMNTIITAFFNNRTVLFASSNNHPIDELVNKLKSIKYQNHMVPFPVIRLGNTEVTLNSLKELRSVLRSIQNIAIYESTLDKNLKQRTEQARHLTELLDKYDTKLDLLERKDAIDQLLRNNKQMNFSIQIETQQIPEIEKQIRAIGDFNVDDALSYVDTDFNELLKYLNYTSIKYLKRIFEPKNEDLMKILKIHDDKMLVKEFNQYLSNPDNLKKFMRIFPVIATTCISAHRLGSPEPVFDMVILDEASQCNNAVSLVPIIRGNNLMLVGDPQQLQPVILLSQNDSNQLRKKYNVTKEYDYCTNSIYKTYLACDRVSDEVLLSHHYRCDPRIIGFNNRKYYNSKLQMNGSKKNDTPLVYIDVQDNNSTVKNTAPKEVDEIIHYVQSSPEKSIGVITPFVKQKELIQKELELHNIRNVDCGTVHAFQGDEKDVILFSLSVTNQTRPETYNWLKNNRELINVSTSRAREKLMLISSSNAINHLHQSEGQDDIYDLVEYVKSSGTYQVAQHPVESRALGIRPYSTETEEAFMTNLNHALDTAFTDGSRYTVHKEVPISQVFLDNPSYSDFFYRGRFDFVVYRVVQRQELPILAIELDGKEHRDDTVVKQRDAKKEAICHEHGFELIRVDNTYARRYHYIKEILIKYFKA